MREVDSGGKFQASGNDGRHYTMYGSEILCVVSVMAWHHCVATIID